MLSREVTVSTVVQLVVSCITTVTVSAGVEHLGELGIGSLYTLPDGITVQDGDTFDYIVVGAGAGGCPAAARLALAGYDVLLVEAGGKPNILSEVMMPAFGFYNISLDPQTDPFFHVCAYTNNILNEEEVPFASLGLLGSEIDWQYPTVPNNVSCLASRNGACPFSRGKCLGGSTSMNYMIFTRGNRRDYDFNVTGWNWPDLKPYFLRYEGLQVLDRYPPSSRPYHNTTGPLKIDFFGDPENPWHSRIIDGFERLNFPFNPDVNGASQIGVTKVAGYVYKGVRMSTARTYLARDDVKNFLKLLENTLCTGVIIDEKNVARGVTVLPKSATVNLHLYARHEVILSAGTIGSAQILMLSGVGHTKHLKKIGIPVRSDLPVGDNMSDHVLPLVLALVDHNASLWTEIPLLLANTATYLVDRSGPLSSNGLSDVNIFANSYCYNQRRRRLESKCSIDCELPNMQIINSYIPRGALPLAKSAFQQATNLDSGAVDQIVAANAEFAIIVHSPVVLTPFSHGKIRLAGADPTRPPAIFPNYLSDERDADLMLRSITILEHLYETREFENNKATILHLKFPGCPRYERDRIGYWRCYVRYMTYAVFHATGTCSLNRVVDARLRVKGVRRLRVADLSVVPRVPRGNTEAVAVAVGERVADLLLEDAPAPSRTTHSSILLGSTTRRTDF